ncbi:MAG: DegT/DnrJ/EryC1/StrS family aminotransferase [Actinomycetota bacterium]
MSAIAVSTPIPFQDLGRLHQSIETELREAIDDVIARSGFVGAGSCAGFEASFAAAHDAAFAVGCGSGTDALALALRGLGIGPGDEVIVPAMTFVASAEAVVHVGATPVLVDVDPTTLLIDPYAVDAARTDRTAAVMAVHLYGHVVPFNQIRAWRASGLRVIEDAAQAHLATWQHEFVGAAGDVACFSFYPGKNLGAFGDGGAVITDDADVHARITKLRDHGRESKYRHDEIGWCSRLDGIQAAVLEVKLRHLPEWTEQRRVLAERYRERLGARLVPWNDGAVHHLLVVRVAADQRDEIVASAAAAGVRTGVHYPIALSDQPSLASMPQGLTHNARQAADEVLSLPMDPLMTLSEVELVCDVLDSIW